MEPQTKQRVQLVMNVVKVAFNWGFIPVVIYCGFRKGADPGSQPFGLASLIW